MRILSLCRKVHQRRHDSCKRLIQGAHLSDNFDTSSVSVSLKGAAAENLLVVLPIVIAINYLFFYSSEEGDIKLEIVGFCRVEVTI